MREYWEKLHPEYPMKAGETLFICICKMNYLYQTQKSNKKNDVHNNNKKRTDFPHSL